MGEEKEMFGLSGKVVIITGGSGQLGASYQQLLLECGAKVVSLDLSDVPETNLWKSSSARLFVECDITRKDQIINALKVTQDVFGCPNALINNAALDSPPNAPAEETGPLEHYPEASWDKVIEVNLKGTFLCSQVFGAAMAEQKEGSIVNVSSIYGVVSPDQSIYDYRRSKGEVFFKPVAYSASKSAVINLTRYLATYWARQGVRVNNLTIAGVFNNQDREFLDAYCKRIPIGRMANPDDYFGALMFLCGDLSRYMTGSNLVVDGGWTAI